MFSLIINIICLDDLGTKFSYPEGVDILHFNSLQNKQHNLKGIIITLKDRQRLLPSCCCERTRY